MAHVDRRSTDWIYDRRGRRFNVLKVIRLDEETVLKTVKSIESALGFESLCLRNYGRVVEW